MAEIIIMPKQGLQMTEGLITRWLAAEGDAVAEGQDLFEMETDKLTIAIPAAASGTLLKILQPEGSTVPITQPIAVLGQPGEDVSALAASVVAATDAAPPAAPPDMSASGSAPTAPLEETETSPPQGGRFATPRARLRAEERGIDAASLPGSGPQGLVIERDVLAAQPLAATPLARKEAALVGANLSDITGSAPRGKIRAEDVRAATMPRPEANEGGETLVPFTGMRRVVAGRMKDSLLEMAQANHRITVDMSAAVALRESLKAAGVKVSYNDILLRCTAAALMEFPSLNASWTDEGILRKHYVNLGVAVAVEEGLLVPVIRDAHRLTLPELAAQAADLAARAKENKLTPEEMSGGTFTVSNLGMFGLDSFTAIINPPEAGILAVGRIAKQPVVVEDQVHIRPLVQLSLSYDHRVVDGAPAARFVSRVKELLETPGLLL